MPPAIAENDAFRAVKTALEIRTSLREMNIDHGIGIASGNVYVGSVGSKRRQEHAVVSDTVNSAARLSGKALQNEYKNRHILIDEATYLATRDRCTMKDAGSIQVKGKDRLIRIFEPIELKHWQWNSTHYHSSLSSSSSTTTTTTHDDSIAAASIGRHVESALVEKEISLYSSNSSFGKIIWVEGEEGVGKSHLLQNFHRLALIALIPCIHTRVETEQPCTQWFVWKVIWKEMLDQWAEKNEKREKDEKEKIEKEKEIKIERERE